MQKTHIIKFKIWTRQLNLLFLNNPSTLLDLLALKIPKLSTTNGDTVQVYIFNTKENTVSLLVKVTWSLVCSFIQGFITRGGPVTELNYRFIQIARKQYLVRLSHNLPQSILVNSWPVCPVVCRDVSIVYQTLLLTTTL